VRVSSWPSALQHSSRHYFWWRRSIRRLDESHGLRGSHWQPLAAHGLMWLWTGIAPLRDGVAVYIFSAQLCLPVLTSASPDGDGLVWRRLLLSLYARASFRHWAGSRCRQYKDWRIMQILTTSCRTFTKCHSAYSLYYCTCLMDVLFSLSFLFHQTSCPQHPLSRQRGSRPFSACGKCQRLDLYCTSTIQMVPLPLQSRRA
jgi:hypothetical protein